MNVSSVGKGLNRPVQFGASSPQERGELVAGVGLPSTTPPPASSANASFRDILANYDVHEISPRDFSELVQKLRDAGQISEAEAKELSLVRVELDKENVDPNEPLDLLEFFEQKLATLEKELQELKEKATADGVKPPDAEESLGAVRRHLGWLQKFALVHADKGVEALDARA